MKLPPSTDATAPVTPPTAETYCVKDTAPVNPLNETTPEDSVPVNSPLMSSFLPWFVFQ